MIYYHYRDSGFGMEKEDMKRQVGSRVVYPHLTLMIYYHYKDSGFGMEKEDVKRQVGTELSILALHS